VLAGLLGVSAISVGTSSLWHPGTPPVAAYCLPVEAPSFHFGFAQLRNVLGEVMGQPTDCEHGDGITDDTYQTTTTGLAVYHWCTNTPTFGRGQDHWMLIPNGVEYWAGQTGPPQPVPIVRAPDLRHPCAA
jgi:hypothetical protein